MFEILRGEGEKEEWAQEAKTRPPWGIKWQHAGKLSRFQQVGLALALGLGVV